MASFSHGLWPHHHTLFLLCFHSSNLSTDNSQVLQLWNTCLPENAVKDVVQHCVQTIQKLEDHKIEEATCKALQKQALQEAKKLGKDAFEAEKNCITQENLKIAKEKKEEKLQQVATKQVEKARHAASKPSRKHKAVYQTVEGLPEGEPQQPPPPPASMLHGDSDGLYDDRSNKFSLHPSDPANFLKLSVALHILIRWKLTSYDISQAEALIREYVMELMAVSNLQLSI